jgi:hypothetical protein
VGEWCEVEGVSEVSQGLYVIGTIGWPQYMPTRMSRRYATTHRRNGSKRAPQDVCACVCVRVWLSGE